jgi:uncharacterized protein (DUF433 family)
MNLPDFLTQHPDGEIVLVGHRIGLYHIVHFYQDGFSPEMLVGQFPTVPLALIHRVIAFYLDNRAEGDAYVNTCRDQLDSQQASSPRHIDVAGLRKRLESTHRAEAS